MYIIKINYFFKNLINVSISKFEFEMKHRNNTRKFSVDIQKTGCIEFDNAIKDQIQITILQLSITFGLKTKYF